MSVAILVLFLENREAKLVMEKIELVAGGAKSCLQKCLVSQF